jgi:hypothetical protein
MKIIFFLLPILVIGVVPFSFAEKGLNYDDIILSANSDGTETRQWTSAPERILSDGEYIDFRFINGANFLSVETGHGSIKLDKNTCSFSFYKKGIISGQPLFIDSIVPKMANNGTETWNELTQISNASCETFGNENQLVAKKYAAGIGFIEYKYINTGIAWKTQLEATNISSQIDKKFGFTQTIDLNRDVIDYGGSEKNLDDYANTTFGRTWLESNNGKIINLLNDVYFDLDLGFDNLKSIAVYDTGLNKSKLSFNYLNNAKIILPNETLIIDPTFSYTAGTVYDLQHTGAGCITSYMTNGGTQAVGRDGSGCYVLGVYWDITTIPDTATPTQTNIRYDVTGSNGAGVNCEWNSIEGNLSTQTTQQRYDDAVDGTTFVSGSTQCNSIANNKVLTLGSTANTDLKNELSVDNEWGIGIEPSSFSSTDYLLFTGGTIELEVTYITTRQPYAVTDLTSTSIGSTSVDLDWTTPYAGGGGQTIIGYQINVTTPQTSNPLVFLNNTGTTTSAYTASGLTIGTAYSARVTAWTNVTSGHPLNNATGNVYNFTTAMPQLVGHAPVLSLVDDCYHTCTTQLNLEWTASTLNNLRGYKIERENPFGSNIWATLVGNTTTTALFYNNTGLSTSVLYNYRIYGLNSTGQSTVSNTYEMTTHKLPNAVNPLTASANEFTDVDLTWTAPIHHSPGIINYQINYTTPYGLPQTIWSHPVSNTPSATVTGLTIGNDYSFRVTAITIHGMNSSGAMIANSTTSTVFELGNLPDPDTTNLDDFKIFFTRTNTNATSILLDVTYPASYALSCNIFQKLAATNQTYTGLTETPVVGPGADVNNVVSSFRFNGPNDEIIHVICTDLLTGDEAYYIITITDFELLDQIANFRNGTYGTTGKIGGLDLITLFIIIIGMIGFNRVNPIAGVAFSVITIGIAAFFEIIAFYQIMFPAVAMVVLWAYTRTRQHD